MRRVKSGDTEPEIILRKALWAAGWRYRVRDATLAGKPDIVFPSKRLAIFVDGDFWHGNQWRMRGLRALENQFHDNARATYWLTKIRKNMQRDCESTQALLASGWLVLRFWESDIRSNLEACLAIIGETAGADARLDLNSLVPAKTVAEFFAGIGLVRLALEQEGWVTKYANDIDEQKHAMYRAEFGSDDNAFHLADVHDVAGSRIPSVTLATASFPCNDLSLAGARRGLAGEQSSAFWGFVRVLREMGERKPPLVLLENVPVFLTSHNGRDFADTLG